MKKFILLLLVALSCYVSKAQFTGTDSLRNFNNRFITTNASAAFTNLRLHNLLAGMIDYIDTALGGGSGSVSLGIDTMYVTSDSVFHYKKNGVFRTFVIRGNPGAGTLAEIPFSNGFGRFNNDSNFIYDRSQGLDAGRLIVGPVPVNDGGLSKINATSDNMNALSLTSYGTGLNTVIFRRAEGTIGTPLALTSGKDLWNFSGRGYTGAVFTQSRAAIYAQTSQNWTDTTNGTRLYFATTTNDSAVMRVRMLIDDSLQISPVRASNSDSVLGARRNSNGLYTITISPVNTSLVLSNIGSGLRWVATPGGNVKTATYGYGVNGDSTTNANTITVQVDTTELNHVITQSDLNDAIGGATPAITQLTGDVTAGPGSGSQVATIAANAVVNSKFRQSVGQSVVGRSVSSTGNVADIQATITNTYLRNSGTTVLWDSVDYGHLKNKPDIENPGVYFSPAQAFDPSFVVFSSGIAKTSNAYSQGNPILWDFLDHTTSHNSSFYDSVFGSGSGITVRFPTVKNVLNTTITPDETFAAHMVSLGSSTAVNNFSSPVIQPAVLNIKLRGNGTTSWTTDNGLGLTSHWSFSAFSSGATLFNIVGGETTIDYPGLNIQYIGPNNYHIKRVYSGLGSFNAAFYIVDEFGNAVTDNPTSSDEVVISAGATAPYITNMVTWQPTTQFMDGFANFWIFGAFECWLVASPTTSTSINVRWQTTYPSATNYKIYRATSLYGARTLIHTGTDGAFVDSGLSSGTLYWYFMVAVVGGVDTQVTYFRTSTKA